MIMSLGNLKRFKILEILSVNLNGTGLAVLIVALAIEFLLLHIFLDKKKISSFFLGFYSLLLHPVDQYCDSTSIENRESNHTVQEEEADVTDDQSVRGGDVEMVLRSLGMFSDQELLESSSSIPDRLDEDGILSIFEEESVGFDEVKDAFDVFDDNRDGFIDAKELQKVLCGLGLKEGLEMENCKRMIGAFDENGDGKIDFVEFVKFMEINF